MKTFVLFLVFGLSIVAIAVAQQPVANQPVVGCACAGRQRVDKVVHRGLIPWKVERSYQSGTNRQTFKRGIVPWKVDRTYSR